MNTHVKSNKPSYQIHGLGTLTFLGQHYFPKTDITLVQFVLDEQTRNEVLEETSVAYDILHPLYTQEYENSGWKNFPGAKIPGFVIWITLKGHLESKRGITRAHGRKLDVAYHAHMNSIGAVWCSHCTKFVFRKNQLGTNWGTRYANGTQDFTEWWDTSCGHPARRLYYHDEETPRDIEI